MKDKTHSMNMGHSEAGAVNGFERLPAGEMASSADRKNRQLKWAGLDQNEALAFQEDMDDKSGNTQEGGFLRRHNIHDRF